MHGQCSVRAAAVRSVLFKDWQKAIALTAIERSRSISRSTIFLFIVIAVADAHSSRVPPDLGGQEQEAQPCRLQRRVMQSLAARAFLAVEQQQPAVQVVGQHRQLKVIAIGLKAAGRMRRQTGIVVGFFDQILGTAR